jgi:hypothetical protein
MILKRKHTFRRSWVTRNSKQFYDTKPHEMARWEQTGSKKLMALEELWACSRSNKMPSVSEVLSLLSGHHRKYIPTWTTALPCSLTWPLTSYSSPKITHKLSDAANTGDQNLDIMSYQQLNHLMGITIAGHLQIVLAIVFKWTAIMWTSWPTSNVTMVNSTKAPGVLTSQSVSWKCGK